MSEAPDLADRAIVVTGGTGALGTGVVRRLVAAGARVHVPCVDERELDAFPLKDEANVSVVYPVDLADEEAVAAYFDGIEGLWASVHVAGGFAFAPIADVTGDDLDGQLRINTRTCLLCCKHAARRMTGGGRIVNVTARPALDGFQAANLTAYTAAKAGVASITQGLATELLEDGILVNAIAPSTIDTPANREAMADADFDRWVTPEDAAEVVAFLVSPRNRVVSGALVPVYGRA